MPLHLHPPSLHKNRVYTSYVQLTTESLPLIRAVLSTVPYAITSVNKRDALTTGALKFIKPTFCKAIQHGIYRSMFGYQLMHCVKTLLPFADSIFKHKFFSDDERILVNNSLIFDHKFPIDKSALAQEMAWCSKALMTKFTDMYTCHSVWVSSLKNQYTTYHLHLSK